MINKIDEYMEDFNNSMEYYTSNKIKNNSNELCNMWDYLKQEGFDRDVILHVSIELDNINNVIEKLTVLTIDGNEVVFEDVILEI